MLKVGDKSPAFVLPSDAGKPVSLKELLNKNLVPYSFPKANTSG